MVIYCKWEIPSNHPNLTQPSSFIHSFIWSIIATGWSRLRDAWLPARSRRWAGRWSALSAATPLRRSPARSVCHRPALGWSADPPRWRTRSPAAVESRSTGQRPATGSCLPPALPGALLPLIRRLPPDHQFRGWRTGRNQFQKPVSGEASLRRQRRRMSSALRGERRLLQLHRCTQKIRFSSSSCYQRQRKTCCVGESGELLFRVVEPIHRQYDGVLCAEALQ